MARRPRSARRTIAPLLCVALAAAIPAPAQAAPPDERGSSVLRRLVHRFDFEDAEARPVTMPRHLRRVPNGPLFGRIALTDEHATGGRWSLGFELDGHSLVAEVVSGVLPVMPGSRYQVSVDVRTEGLRDARARLSAWLFDHATGTTIPGSRVHGEAVRSEGRWTTLAIQVPAAASGAADLVIELEALQPRDLAAGAGPPRPMDEPRPPDVGGRVHFDELAVWLVPRLELRSAAPGGVFVTEPPVLSVIVADVLRPLPDVLLRVEDAAGHPVFERRLSARGRRDEHVVELPDLPLGWYRAIAQLSHAGSGAATTEVALAFARVARTPPTRRDAPQLGVLVPFAAPPPTPAGDDDDAGGSVATMASPLGVAAAIAEVSAAAVSWQSRETTPAALAGVYRDLAGSVDELFLSVDPGAADEVATVARRLSIVLRPWVAGWQLGDAAALGAGSIPAYGSRVSAARMGLASGGGTTLVPWPVEQPVADAERNIVVPYHVRPVHIASLLEPWPTPRTVTLILPPTSLYPPDQRLGDLIERTLQTWRSGVERIFLEAPWAVRADAWSLEPDPIYPAVQQLAQHLQARRFGGRLTLADGVEAWLLEPTGEGDAALVAWSTTGPRAVHLSLGVDPVDASDVFGNRVPVPLYDDRHELALGAMPIFVEGVDLELARFRVAFALEPPYLPTEQRVHERALRITNPWDVPISGSVSLVPTQQWRVSPRASRFTAGPGETIDLPLSLVPSRSMVAGPQTMDAEIELTADQVYRFSARALLDAGLEDLELHESWRIVVDPASGRETLSIRIEVRNVGTRPVTLTAFAQGVGIGVQRQAIGRLDPGELAARTFVIPDGASRLTDGRLYVGVDEQSRVRRLAHEVSLR